jgi:LPXTG-site transpeptidase (sortase) family protein
VPALVAVVVVLIGAGVAVGPTVVASYRSPAAGDATAQGTDVSSAPSEDAATAPPVASAPARPRPDSLTRPARPTRLRTAALGVDARVVPVDDVAGVLQPPDDPQQIGWWRSGARPGDGEGRVLVTGHTVHTGGGAFDGLERLARGDVVEVRTPAGVRSYRVRSTRYLTIERFAARAARLLRQDGPEMLVLVTCDGWDGVTYEGSTVVVATPVGES